LGEIFRRCDLYIGGDTGPLHIASFVGTPIVAIFGPTHPVENEPAGPHRVVRKEVGCNPCHKYSCEDLACMRSVTVDDVFGAVQEILNERGARKELA
jgi:ADP-heptose:LPS heptosyltransferase